MLLLWGIEKNTIIMTSVLGIYEFRKQMRSDWQKKPQPEIHTRERSRGRGGHLSPGCCKLRGADRLRGWGHTWAPLPGTWFFGRHSESRSGSASDTLPTTRRQAVEASGLILEHRVRVLVHKKSGPGKWLVLQSYSCPSVIGAHLEWVETWPQTEPTSPY